MGVRDRKSAPGDWKRPHGLSTRPSLIRRTTRTTRCSSSSSTQLKPSSCSHHAHTRLWQQHHQFQTRHTSPRGSTRDQSMTYKFAPWLQFAEQSKAASSREPTRLQDPHFKKLRLNLKRSSAPPDHDNMEFGDFVHVHLWRALHTAVSSPDDAVFDSILSGFTIAGAIRKSTSARHDGPRTSTLDRGTALCASSAKVRARVRQKFLKNAGNQHAQNLRDEATKDQRKCVCKFSSTERQSQGLWSPQFGDTRRAFLWNKERRSEPSTMRPSPAPQSTSPRL